MTAKWTPHVVRQGEHLAALAARGSVPAAEIWSHPENAYLAKARPSGDLLAPGDVIHVPPDEALGLPLAAGTKNRYAATVPSVRLELYLLRGDDPLRNKAFEVQGAAGLDGTTDGEGALTIHLPLHCREITIVIPDEGLSFPVQIGAMDPIDEPAGVRKRLDNLGFLRRDDADAVGQAIRRFQRMRGLPETGHADDATRDELVRAHGC